MGIYAVKNRAEKEVSIVKGEGDQFIQGYQIFYWVYYYDVYQGKPY